MSLATRCTHCGTIFKVVEDQLKVSEGWVRCGRCQEVFHALPTLFDLDREPPPPRPASAAQSPAGTAAPAPADTAAEADHPSSQLPSEWPATMPQSDLDAGLGHSSAAPPATQANPATEPPPAAAAAPEPPAGPRIGPQPAPTQTRSWLAPVPANTDFDLDTVVPEGTAAAPASEPAPPAAPVTPGLDDIELDTAVELTPKVTEDLTDPDAPPELEGMSAPLSLRLLPMGSTPVVASAAPASSAEFGSPRARQAAASGTDLHLEGLATDSPPDNADDDWSSPSRYGLVPSTEESDALDSRYLLPSTRRDRPAAARRPTDTPDFADAEVPDDWLLDAEEDLAAAIGAPSPHHREPPAPAPVRPAPPSPAISVLAGPPSRRDRADDEPSTIPSRFEDDAAGLVSPPADASAEPAPAPAEAPAPRGSKLRRKARATPEATPGFVQRAQAQARWRHPAVRVSLGVTAVLLLALLAGQMAHQFRDLLAAYHPPLRPYLDQWCRVAGCTIQPPLRIEALQVDSLSFVRATSEGPDTYRLTVVLHNKAPIDLAWPHIDLSLTDLNGAVVVRNVFKPQDASWQDSPEPQAGPGQPLPEAAPAQRSTTLQWRLKIAKLQPAGYTADIFYP